MYKQKIPTIQRKAISGLPMQYSLSANDDLKRKIVKH